MVGGDLELLSQLNCLVEVFLLLAGLSLHFLGSGLDGFLELRVAFLVLIELHVLLGLDEGRDQLTAGLAHI